MVLKFLSAAGNGGNIPLVVIGVRVRSLAVVPGFHLGRGGRRAGVHIGDGGVDHGGATVFGGQARHAAEAVIGVVGGDRALRRLGQPVILVIGVGAGGGCAVLFAHLARDVAVLVVAVRERNLTRAAGGLGEQIANAVIAVCRCQGAGCSFNPPACRIVGVGGSTPVWNEGFTFNYLDLLNPFDNDTYQSQL